MTNIIQPLLAKKADYDKIQYPVLATPKLDGIRCLMVDGLAVVQQIQSEVVIGHIGLGSGDQFEVS